MFIPFTRTLYELSALTLSVAAVGNPETMKVFVNVEVSLIVELSTVDADHIQLAPGMDAVHAALYGVATNAAGFPFTVFVTSLTMEQDVTTGAGPTTIVDVAVLLAPFGFVEDEDSPIVAVFVMIVLVVTGFAVPVRASVATVPDGISPIVQISVEEA